MAIRSNENPVVWEESGRDLNLLLIELAGVVEKEDGWVNLTLQYDLDAQYTLTAYLHR